MLELGCRVVDRRLHRIARFFRIRPPATNGPMSAWGGEFNWLPQHRPEISLLVFRSLTFFSGARSTAAPLC